MKRLGKIVLTILLFVTVTACAGEDKDVDLIINETIKNSRDMTIPEFTNINKDYYQYYLPKDVGRKHGDVASNIFTYRNSDFIMCVNMPNIIKDYFYHETAPETEIPAADEYGSGVQLREYEGTYIDYGNRLVDFKIYLITVDENLYFLQLITRYLSFGTVTYKGGLELILSKIIEMARTVRINYELIAVDFSNREVQSGSALQALDLFKNKKPSSGYLIDLMNPNRPAEEEESE